MQIETLTRGCVRVGFAAFAVFATLDLVVLVGFDEYREAFGATDGMFDGFNLSRIGLDLWMILFYGKVAMRMRHGGISSRLLVWHGLVYGLLGLMLCIPFAGFFFAPLTPVGLLYMGSLLSPFTLYGSYGVAIAFIVFNIFLVWVGATKRISCAPSKL
jgi:hypothetical protein